MKSQYVFNKSVILIIGLLFVLCFSSCSTAGKVGANLEKEYIEKEFTQRAIRRNGDFLKQFSYPNSVYVIKKKINLKGQSIAIAPGSVLLFKGGSIKNGSIVGNKTTILGNPKIAVLISGTFLNKEINSFWFINNSEVTVSAIKAACSSNSTFIVNDKRKLANTVYLFGNGGLKGRGGCLDFVSKTDNGVCILCGTDGQKPNMWKGAIDSLEINIKDYKYGIALCNVSHCAVTNNTINATSVPTYKGGKMISRFNNGTFTHLSGEQTDVLIAGNVLNMHGKSDGTESKSSYESISVCDFTDNARILNNTINNSTDDVGIHSCTNIRVEGNTISTEDGRIYCADSKDVTIANNTLSCYSYGTMGIMITMESQNRICENIIVKDNIVHAISSKGMAYGIRVNNGKHIQIENNQVEGQLHIGYQDYVLENLSHKPVALSKEDKIIDYVVVKDNVFTQINGSGWNKTDNTPHSVLFEGNEITGPKFILSNIPQVKSKGNKVQGELK